MTRVSNIDSVKLMLNPIWVYPLASNEEGKCY